MEFDNFDTEITCEEYYGNEESYEQDDDFDEYDDDIDCDDSDDGYALASAGFGTDEDYGGYDSDY